MGSTVWHRNLLHIALNILRNRNVLLVLSFTLGIAFGPVAEATRSTALPALALVVAVSTTQMSTSALLKPRALARPVLLSIIFNYLIQSTFLIVVALWLVPDPDLRVGLILIAIVPPQVATVPYAYMLGGDATLALFGTVGAYLASLLIAPAMAVVFIGQSVITPQDLVVILAEMVIAPLILSRLMLATGIARRITRWRGVIINWLLSLVVFTIVGLNQDVFLGHFRTLALLSAIGIANMFVLGYFIERVLVRLGVSRPTAVSLILFGTGKNYAMSSAIALTLLGARGSVPSAVLTVYSIIYFVWLGLRADRRRF